MEEAKDCKNYKKIAQELENELLNLWNDIESALDLPDNARRILTNGLKYSQRAVKDIKKFN